MQPQEHYVHLDKTLDKETFCRNLYEEIRKLEAFQEQFLANERHIAASSSYLDLGLHITAKLIDGMTTALNPPRTPTPRVTFSQTGTPHLPTPSKDFLKDNNEHFLFEE